VIAEKVFVTHAKSKKTRSPNPKTRILKRRRKHV